MRKRIMCGLVFGVAVAVGAWAADKIQPMNVRLGLWKATITTANSGQMPLPNELLSRLTPEQRARLQERMKSQSGADSRTTTYKTCLTKEERDKDDYGLDKQGCTQTIIMSTSSKLAGKATCVEDGIKYAGTLELEAISPEHVKGSMHMTATNGGDTVNVNQNYEGKWLGASCGNVN